MKVQKSIAIEASRQSIWPFLVQPAKILEWYEAMHRLEYRGEQRGGVGTTFYAEEEAAGHLMKLNFVITDWVEYERIAFKMTSSDFVKSYEQTWTLEPVPTGTRFTYTEDITLPYGAAGKLLGLFAHRRSQSTLGAMLGKLKGFAEEAQGTRSPVYA
jgi:uncharacterized protein YndB with AHSA1/START domain